MEESEVEYRKWLVSGLFWEFYPTLTRNFYKDKKEWLKIYEEMCTNKAR